MKKQYMRPQSRLFVINLAENISTSLPNQDDVIEVKGHVKITAGSYYSTVQTAVVAVSPGSPDEAYEEEFFKWVSKGYFELYVNCFK